MNRRGERSVRSLRRLRSSSRARQAIDPDVLDACVPNLILQADTYKAFYNP
jgi:hypothetical protein